MPSLAERTEERRRAVALARHLRDSERLSNAQIARRLGRSPATVKGYFYDPEGKKAKAVKARYRGSCRQCGAPTQARSGKVLQELPSRSDRRPLDPRPGDRGHARLAGPLRATAELV